MRHTSVEKSGGHDGKRPRRRIVPGDRRVLGMSLGRRLAASVLVVATAAFTLVAIPGLGSGVAGASTPTTVDWAQQAPSTSPTARYAAVGAYDPATGQFILFGGYSNSGLLGDTWDWTGTDWTQLAPAISPPARDGAVMAYDASTQQLLLFGGQGASGDLNDTWDWTGTDWTQLSPATSPPARRGASMAYDGATDQLLLFGGSHGSTDYLNDTWEWSGTDWVQLNPITSPAARRGASLTYDVATSQLLLFGGSDAHTGTTFGDTWLWNGSTWVELHPSTSPSSRQRPAVAYDSTAVKLVLFGGDSASTAFLADTWTWNGTTWVELAPSTSPPARYDAAMDYDPSNGGLVLFGGFDGSILGDTWTEYAVGQTVPGAPTIGTATADYEAATVSFSPPASNGNSAITSYTVTASDQTTPARGGETASRSTSPIFVSGLTDGDSYTFTVTATNGIGTGPASEPSNAVTPENFISVTSVSPQHVITSSTTELVITGQGFAPNETAYVVRRQWKTHMMFISDTQFVSSTTIDARLHVGKHAEAGPKDVEVQGVEGIGTCLTCVVVDQPPSIRKVTPSTMASGVTETLTVSGSAFQPGATLTFLRSRTEIGVSDVSVVSPSSITATVTVSKALRQGRSLLEVRNPDGGTTGRCNPRRHDCFLTVVASPTLKSMTPSTVAPGSVTTVTLSGSGFGAGAQLKGPSGVVFSQIKVVNSSTIDATMTVISSATPGTNLPVRVKNTVPEGDGQAMAKLLTIT